MAGFGPADIGSVLQGIGSVLGPFAVGYAAWVASNTFEGWRRQKLSERRIEQAERILTATYKARRALAYVRGALILAHELSAAEADLEKQEAWSHVAKDRKQKFISAQATFNRLDKVVEERRAVEECLPMARALFGDEVENALETLNRQFHLVSIAADMSRMEGNDREFDRALREDLSSTGGSSRRNKMDDLIAEQVTLIEAVCRPVLRLELRG